jgi:hypothetical protein
VTAQEQAAAYAQIEERLLGIIRRNKAALREFRGEFDKAERAKQQAESEYQRRRLQRLSGQL